jgi:wyosine [tRNA(Phe)-imidazoG37] synthetase (radical SAM superfamily)
MMINRKEFCRPEDIFNEVSEKIRSLQKAGGKIDFLTFVPDGEPTLDINLGITIEKLKIFGVKIAVITNSSLLWDKDVRNDLAKADLVSIKIDSAYENIWKIENRPHGMLDFRKIIDGAYEFAAIFKGTLVTETMLIRGVNDTLESLNKTARIISEINPYKSYILVPMRPPAEKSVKCPSVESMNNAYQIYSSLIGQTELINYSEGTDFTYFSNAEKELLDILAVHPMRKDAVEEFLSKSNYNWELIDNLIDKNVLVQTNYSGNDYLIKKI